MNTILRRLESVLIYFICFVSLTLVLFGCGSSGGSGTDETTLTEEDEGTDSGDDQAGDDQGDDQDGDGETSLAVTIQGILSGYNIGGLHSALSAKAVSGTVDKIWALPVYGGDISIQNFQYKKEVDIEADGSFSISFDQEGGFGNDEFGLRKKSEVGGGASNFDWLLLLVNSTALQKKDRLVGYLTMKDVNDSLVKMPLTEAEPGSTIDMGTVEQDGDEAVSSTELSDNADNFSLTLEQLQELAKTDNVFKNIKNAYINYDEDTGEYYTLEPGFGWSDNMENIHDQFSDPADYAYQGYQIYLDTNNTTNPEFENLTGASKEIISLYPPSSVSKGGNQPATYDENNPISNEENITISTRSDGRQECSGQDFYARNDVESIMYNFVTGDTDRLEGEIPEGFWTMKNDTTDEELAFFDIAAASPVDSEGNPNTYVPAIKVNTEQDGKITSIDVKWYIYDSETSEFVELTDTTALQTNFRYASISLDDYAGQRIEELQQIDSDSNTISTFDNEWYFSGTVQNTDDVAVADSIAVNYSIAGVSIRFVW